MHVLGLFGGPGGGFYPSMSLKCSMAELKDRQDPPSLMATAPEDSESKPLAHVGGETTLLPIANTLKECVDRRDNGGGS